MERIRKIALLQFYETQNRYKGIKTIHTPFVVAGACGTKKFVGSACGAPIGLNSEAAGGASVASFLCIPLKELT